MLREFKGMVKLLHEAGLEVLLDVVYNHTAEEGIGGPRTSLRGIDNRAYYRQTAEGVYIDETGCGNAVKPRRMPRPGSCWTPCATGRKTCRSTGSASISP